MVKKATKKAVDNKKAGKRTASPKGKEKDQQGQDEEVASMLAELGEDYEAPATDSGFEDLPDGSYQTQINEIVINKAQSSGRLQITFETTVVSGEYTNRKIFLHLGLDSKENIGRTKGQLLKLDFEVPAEPDALPDELQELVDTYAEVLIKCSKSSGSQWRTFTGALAAEDIEEPEADGPKGKRSTTSGTSGKVTATSKTAETGKKTVKKTTKKKDAAPEVEFEVGSRVFVDEFGESELGLVTTLDDENANIEFDDGTSGDYPLAEIHLSAEQGEAPAEEATGVTLKFTDEDLTDQQIQSISLMGEAAGYDSDKYDSWAELLADVAEEAGVAGEFDSCKKLILEVKKASK